MNCYKCKQKIDDMHNDCIDNNELQSVLQHIQKCESCNKHYVVMDRMLGELSSLEEKPLPEGFHNRLHFALQREAERPVKKNSYFPLGLKYAAIGACSVLLVMVAFSILPKNKFDAMPNIAMDEASEEVAEASQMEIQSQEKEFSAVLESVETSDDMNSRDGEEMPAENYGVQSTDMDETDLYFNNGDSAVLILDVDDVDQTYNDLLEFISEPLPDTEWSIEDIDEPSDYRQLRMLMDINEAQLVAGQIAMKYFDNVEFYAIKTIEYAKYQEEISDLQNMGYIFIILK